MENQNNDNTVSQSMETLFPRKGTLTWKKLKEYIPIMILTNMSVFILSTVDGVVAGNLISGNALAAIHIFSPAMVIITVVSGIIDSGSATSMSTCIGKNDLEAIRRTKVAVRVVIIAAAIFVVIIEYPIISAVIKSYSLSPEVESMTWDYAKGIMIALPVGVITSVLTYQLQIIGKMKVIMVFSVLEGILNLLLDIFFVQVMGLGLAGISFGTACACTVRCVLTVIYMARKTDMFVSEGAKPGWTEIKDILRCGSPDGANMAMLAFQYYFIMKIILMAFGDAGGRIKGVCFFAFHIVNIVILGVTCSTRPLAGLYSGAKDFKAMRDLMRRSVILMAFLVGACTIIVELFPGVFFRLNGVKTFNDDWILSLRLFALYFVFRGIDAILRLYLVNRKDSMTATVLTIVGNATMPVFAFAFSYFFSAPFLWLGYLAMELLLFLLSTARYLWWLKKDRADIDPSEKVLYLGVKPEEAIEVSRMIRRFADDNGCSARIAYRMSLAAEEMVAYVVKSQKQDNINIMLMTRFRTDEGIFCMFDDGECISLNVDKETTGLITDNYGLLKKVAKSVEYQYILNMNYTVIRF